MGALQILCRPLGETERQAAAHLLTGAEQRMLRQNQLNGITAFVGTVSVGVLLYSLRDGILRVENIFVTGGYRRSGVGTEMVQVLCSMAQQSPLPVIIPFDAEDNRDRFYRFLMSMRRFSIVKQEGFEAFLTKETVAQLCEKYQKKQEKTEYYFSQSKKMQQDFCMHLQRAFPAVAWELENDNHAYRRDLCICRVEQGEVQAVCLLKDREAALELSLLYTKPQQGMLGAKVLLDAIGTLDPEKAMPLWVAPAHSASVKILDQLCPRYEITKRFYIAYDMGETK